MNSAENIGCRPLQSSDSDAVSSRTLTTCVALEKVIRDDDRADDQLAAMFDVENRILAIAFAPASRACSTRASSIPLAGSSR